MDCPHPRAIEPPETGRVIARPEVGGFIPIMSGWPRDEERAVYTLLRFLLMALVSTGVWMAIGLGVGWVLHRVVPAIDLGMATLIAVVALGGSFRWLSRSSTLEAFYRHEDIDGSDATWSTTPPAEWRPAQRKRRRRES